MGDGWLVKGGGTVSSAGVGRVVVGVSGSLGNLAALHAAVEQARLRAVELVAVVAWLPVGGELAHRRAPCPPLLRLWREQATDMLRTALVNAFGGPPPDLVLTSLAVRGPAGPVLVAVAGRPGDLLVVGAGRRGHLSRVCHGAVSRYCVAHARCPVLAVPPPDLISEIRHGLRLRGRDLTRAGLGGGTAAVKRR